jgi:ATP-binding cassette, subfamily C, type I secretion system permease/ATPase
MMLYPDKLRLPKPLSDALGACRTAFVALFLFSMAINVLLLAAPIYMMQVYDRVLNSRSVETLVMLTVMVVVAFVVMGALELVRGRVMIGMGRWLDERLGPEVLTGDIIAALRRSGWRSSQGLRDLAIYRSFLTGPGVFPIMDAPWAPLFLTVLFILHPFLGVIGTAGAVVLFALALANELCTRNVLREAGGAARNSQLQADMAVRNADVVEAMGMLPGLVQRWSMANADMLTLQAKAANRASWISTISKVVRVGLQSVILGAGAYLAIEHEASAGVMIAASIILGRALSPVEQAIGAWKGLVAARGAYARLKAQLLATPPRGLRTSLPAPEGNLRLDGVVFAPPGVKEAMIKSVTFELAAGETVAMIGPSAAGKTTLARLIVGSWQPQRGSVRLDGADIANWEPDELGPHVGYLPQDIELFAGTIRDNIARMGTGDDAAVIEAARKADVHDMILDLPNGYDTEIGDGGAFLSGGQRQRIALARALYGDPKLLVLDEPSSSLDAAAEQRMIQTLAALKGKATVVLVTHRLNFLALADKVMILRGGVVEAFGPRDDVMARRSAGEAPLRAVAGSGGAALQLGPFRHPHAYGRQSLTSRG